MLTISARPARLVLRLALFAGVLAMAAEAASQQRNTTYSWPAVEVFRQPQGLPQNSVLAILQTRDGYLWIGSKGGVSRFDGVRFTTFDDSTPGQLRENEVWALAEADDGSLWIGTYGGGVSRYQDGRFTSYGSAEGLINDFVTAIQPVGDSVWIATDAGLSRFQNGRFTNYTAREGLPFPSIRALELDADGRLWIGGLRGGVATFENGRFHVAGVESGGPAATADVVYFYPDARTRSLWVGSTDGLYLLRDGRWSRFTIDDGLPSNRIRFIAPGADGALWIGTAYGLASYHDGAFITYNFGDSWASPELLSFCRDREGSFWLGSRNSGLAHAWQGSFRSFTTKDGLADPYVAAVLEDRSGTIWMGTYRGLNALTRGHITRVGGEHGLGGEKLISTLAEDREGRLWVGGEAGLFRSTTPPRCAGGRCDTRFATIKTDLVPNLFVRNLFIDRDDTVWAGTNFEGLLKYRHGRFTLYNSANGLPHDAVRGLQQDRRGRLWIGTRGGGLAQLADGRFTIYTERDGLLSDNIQALYIDSDDVLWIATRQGLSRFKAGRFASVTVGQGLYENYIYGLAEDDAGNMWMKCSKGVFSVRKDELNAVADGRARTLKSEIYGVEHGLSNTTGTAAHFPGVYKSADGRVWFPMVVGIDVVDPKRVTRNTLPPPVHIESVSIDQRAFQVTRPAEAAPGRGDLVFHYAGLSFLAPEKVRFRVPPRGVRRGLDRRRRSPERLLQQHSSRAVHLPGEGGQQRRSLERHGRELRDLPRAPLLPERLVLRIRPLRGRPRDGRPLSRARPEPHGARTAARAPGGRAHRGAAAREGGGRGRGEGEERVSGQHEPRDPDADERRAGHDRAGARHRAPARAARVSRDRRTARRDLLLTVINDILDFSKIEAGSARRRAPGVPIYVRSSRPLREPAAAAGRTEGPRAPRRHGARGAGGARRRFAPAGAGAQQPAGERHQVHACGRHHAASLAERAAPGRRARDAALRGAGYRRRHPAEQQKHIFEPFRQADGIDDPKVRRHGAGTQHLAASRRARWAAGSGSKARPAWAARSTSRFPHRASHRSRRSPHRRRSRPAATPLRVLLAEDNRINQRVAVAMLELEGHRVKVVDNGDAAVAAATTERFDVILMDVQMPGMSGFDATGAIRAHEARGGGHVPIIAMTAHAMPGDRERCEEAGMDGYVAKPIMPDALRKALLEASLPSFS